MASNTGTEVFAYRCATCGKLHYPKHLVCTECGGREFEEVALEGPCKLVTWTRTYNLPEGYMKPSIFFGIVAYPNGIVASGQLEADSPTIGMDLTTGYGVVKEGIGHDNFGLIFTQA
jgi:uncharacterized OB-fold protein